MSNTTTRTLKSASKNRLFMSILVFTSVLSAVAAGAGPFASAEAAYNPTRVMARSGLEAIAAAVPGEPGGFVAALHVPGRTLLVVSARHPSAELIASRIAQQRYREVYIDHLRTSTPQGKVYIQDANADGIAINRGGDLRRVIPLIKARQPVDPQLLADEGIALGQVVA